MESEKLANERMQLNQGDLMPCRWSLVAVPGLVHAKPMDAWQSLKQG
jgi:hypothetical protein